MLAQPARRSLLALAGATAGLASLAVGSTAAAAQADLAPDAGQESWLPPDTVVPGQGRGPQATCSTFRDFLPNNPINVPIPTDSGGNGNCTMGIGNQGAAVKILQQAIFDCYPQFRSTLGSVDAVFGQRTANALAAVQRAEGVSADGVYGPNTKNAMEWPGYINSQLVDCRPLV